MNLSACSRLAILAVLGVVPAAAPRSKQTEWHVIRLKARILINPDSSLLVDETQIIPESPDPNFTLACVAKFRLENVSQVPIDEVWSTLRFRPLEM